ncbi:MAG TPA: GNAT family N-acetyltransferase [Thermoplasmata archaeon]
MAGDDRDALRLRPARRSDEPTIWRATMETVWRDVPEDERVGLDRAAFEAHFREYAADFVEGRRGERFVAEDAAGRLLGYVILGELTPFSSPSPVGFVYDIWVAPEHRGRGVGRFLIQESERWARAKGYATIKLEVAEANLAAMALYRSAGYGAEREYLSRRLR